MPSSITSTEKASSPSVNSMDNKKTPVADATNTTITPAKRSLFRRATSKLRSAVCLPDDKSSTSADSESKTDEKKTDEKKDEKDDKDNKDDAKKDDKPEDQTMKTEFKHLDRKFDSEDTPYFVERKKEAIDVEKKNWWELFSFCIVRRYLSDGDLDETCLYVNPQPLRQLLKDVIGDYPSDPIDVDDVQIASPYHSLFHYRKQLEEVGTKRFEDSGDNQSLEQLKLLLGWIRTNFELEIAAHERCLSSSSKAIAYEKLWTLFGPGTIVCARVNQHDRAFRVHDYWYDDDDDEFPSFNLRTRYVDYDGDGFGTTTTTLSIGKYAGTREVSSHPVRPLDFVEDAAEFREKLLARGKRFAELAAGQNFMQYKGIALKRDPECPRKYLRFDATGRFMIDAKTYHRLDANDVLWVTSFDKDHGEGLTEDDMLLANAMVRGYSLTAKRFLEFSLDKVAPIEWNDKCFEELVLDAGTKKTVQALVSTHSRQKTELADEDFDDIVKGKGKGLVCVLHGPPGVGKTLTAECMYLTHCHIQILQLNHHQVWLSMSVGPCSWCLRGISVSAASSWMFNSPGSWT